MAVAKSHCDLGLIVTDTLSWSEHIAAICKRANSFMYLLKKTFQSASFATYIQLYKTYVRPIIEYAGPVWSVNLVRDRNLLESVQRRATRLSFGVTRPSYEQRLLDAKLTSIEERRLRGDLIITYRALNNLFSCDLSPLFVINSDTRLRGHNFKLVHENYRTSTREGFIANRVFPVWNSLPRQIVGAASVNMFKNMYDAWKLQV